MLAEADTDFAKSLNEDISLQW